MSRMQETMEIRQPTMNEVRRHVANGRRMRAQFIAAGVHRAVIFVRNNISALLGGTGQTGHKASSVQGMYMDMGRR